MEQIDVFIEVVEEYFNSFNPKKLTEKQKTALDYFEKFKSSRPKCKLEVTKGGLKILFFMYKNKTLYDNYFKAKDIAAGLSSTSQTISGSMHKLEQDGYVKNNGSVPIVYSITPKGEECVTSRLTK